MRLWIIGNGFDLFHGLHTRYQDYKAYLCQKHTCKKECGRVQEENLPQEVCRNCCKSKIECSSVRYCPVRNFNDLPRKDMREDLWCDLEDACSIDPYELLKRLDGCNMDAIRKGNDSEAKIRLEQDTVFAKHFTATWLSRWFDKIQKEELSHKDKKDRSVAIDKENDLFLTFNYTTTLERIYDVPDGRILYVHGCMKQFDAKNEERKKEGVIEGENGRVIDEGDIGRMYLAFGSPAMTDEAIETALNQYVARRPIDAEQRAKLQHRLLIFAGSLKKDVKGRLDKLKTFMGRFCCELSALDEVVVAGHSLNLIDRPYFDYLTDLLKNVRWRFIFHNEADIRKAFDFCERYKLDGCCVSWDSSKESILGDVPCRERGGVRCQGFSICWPKSHRNNG